jgi:branched-chain amino acid transport system substrate-binding protein
MGTVRIRAIPIVAVLALAVAAGCGSGSSSSSGGGGGAAGAPVNISTCHAKVGNGQFTIVSDLPRQGSNKIQTDQMAEAIQMVLAQNNWKAGKYTLQYQDCDDSTAQAGGYDPATCSSNANAYIRDPSVIGVLGTLNSPCAKLEVPVLNRVGLVEVSAANTNLGLTQPSGEPGEPDKYYPSGVRNYARVVAVDNSQGAVDATLAQKLGAKSVYVLDDKESYGVGVADFFEKAAKELGMTVAGRDSWDPKAANYQALMQKIKAAHPDAIFLGGLICSNGGQLIKDKVAVLGPNSGVKLIAPDGFFISSTLTGQGSAGQAGQGMYVSNAGVPADKLVGAGKTFIDQFKAKYGVSTVQPYTAYAAQTAQVLINAIKASDGSRASVTKNVFGMKITDGILGTFQIGDKGDIIGQQQFTIGLGNSKTGEFDTYSVVNPDPALVQKITTG